MSKFTIALLTTLTVALIGCGGSAFTADDSPKAADSGALEETAVDHVVTIDSGTDRATEPDAHEGESETGIDEGGWSSSSSSGGGSSSDGSSSDSSSDGGSSDGGTCVIQSNCVVFCSSYGPCCVNSSTCGCFNSNHAMCFAI